tara:strand:+ start:1886 stop:2191 length:306 start_codon:yes stop_codon:yes gene_type:complete
MSRLPRKSTSAPRSRSGKSNDDTAFKIKLRGKDNAPLSMQELREGLIEAAKRLEPYAANYRAKWATVYLTMVDENGQAVVIDGGGEWTIFPYRSAADEHSA